MPGATKRYPFNTFTLIGVLSGILIGCSSNTIVDDDSYRTIGSAGPRNPQPSSPAGANSSPLFSVDAEGSFSTDPGAPYKTGIPDGALSNPLAGSSSTGRNHVKRYGNSGVIEKIAQIAQIHCKPLSFPINTNKQSFWGKQSGTLSQCSYRFPEFCGGHQFSILSYADKEVLIYDRTDAPYYIIDTLKGTNASRPGLWDKDDKLGSKASNMGYMFEANYQSQQPQRTQKTQKNRSTRANSTIPIPRHQRVQDTPLNLGWVIKASYHDEIQHGTSYHQAINDTTKCF